MASTKIVLYKSKTLKDGNHPLLIRVIDNRKVKYFSTGYSCKIDEWDSKEQTPTKKHKNQKKLSLVIDKHKVKAQAILLEIDTSNKAFSFEQFSKKFKGINEKQTVFEYFDNYIIRLKEIGKEGTANTYQNSRNAIFNFHGSETLDFQDIDYSFIKRFQEHHQKKGNSGNSISVYLRTLRSIINKAINEGYCKESYYPFKQFKITSIEQKTPKRALNSFELKKLISSTPNPNSGQAYAKDVFLFCFYAMGMNFVDLANLKWESINDERLVYNRSKTGRLYNVKLIKPMLDILDRNNLSPKYSYYVFPILDNHHLTASSKHNRIKKVRKQINTNLKDLGEDIGLSLPLTTYVARHTWATTMKRSGVPVSVISQGLGHTTERTTNIYLDSFDNAVLDSANELLLNI